MAMVSVVVSVMVKVGNQKWNIVCLVLNSSIDINQF